LSEARHALPFSRWRAAAYVVLPVLLVAGGVAFFLLRSSGTKPVGEITDTGSPSQQTPPFDFKLLAATAIPASATVKASELKPVADRSAQEIATTLDRLYSLAFLDPSNWQKGDYQNVYGFFDLGKAQKIAQRDTTLLTLGSGAGTEFASVRPGAGTLKVRVLMDPSGNAFTAVAFAHFSARARDLKSGGDTLVVSSAQYFMHVQEGGWTIYAYRVERNDHAVKSTSPSPAPTPAPSGSASG
jgi:hypothetical protein